ncbi:mitochondrial ribosomal small subunit component [Serendipita sp. 396]|nr:mitochondrial ribosomal small subunit component [Serendipita sp. 396]KAG9054804.1 mitochondrial ribosomal small subunit component [Serendipita sp. 407]
MGRKVPTQVHHAATRLVQGKLLSRPPLWYSAVAQYPPLPLPPRQAVNRTNFDSPLGLQSRSDQTIPEGSSKPYEKMRKEVKPRVMPILYLEDKVRQRFFLDHPFEAFRPRTLVEQREVEPEHPVVGKDWTRLRQRGRNPTSEDCIKFAVSLHVHHLLPLSQAYRTACQQYAALRSEHTIASQVAFLEAKAYGAKFNPKSSEIGRGFKLEEQALSKWNKATTADVNEQASRKKWRPIFPKQVEDFGLWTRGEEYLHKYKAGETPKYQPNTDAISSPVDSSEAER